MSYLPKKNIRGTKPIQEIKPKRWGGIFYMLFLRLHLTYFNKFPFVHSFFFKRFFIVLDCYVSSIFGCQKGTPFFFNKRRASRQLA